MYYTVKTHPVVYHLYPSFVRGLVVARNLDNRGEDQDLQERLERACSLTREATVSPSEDSAFTAWDEAHRRFGSNPNRYPPAHKALYKRASRPKGKLPFINKAVAVMNTCSLLGRLPVSGDDLGSVGCRLELRLATGDEHFRAIGSETYESPEPGEVIYADDAENVLCRRWNWRNGASSALNPATRYLLMNVDGLGPGAQERVVEAREHVADLLREYCNAEVEFGLLTVDSPSYSFYLDADEKDACYYAANDSLERIA